MIEDRDSRFVVACATGPLCEDLIAQAVSTTLERTHHRPLSWFSDGWKSYQSILQRAYRQLERIQEGQRSQFRLFSF